MATSRPGGWIDGSLGIGPRDNLAMASLGIPKGNSTRNSCLTGFFSSDEGRGFLRCHFPWQFFSHPLACHTGLALYSYSMSRFAWQDHVVVVVLVLDKS